MLRPQDTRTRERKNLDGLWDFRIDRDGVGHDQDWQAGPLAQSRKMAVPASYNDLVLDQGDREHFGDLWYQTRVRVPRGWAGQQISLYIESATHRATVWVDGVEVGSHEGGYLPFELDLTAVVSPGEEVLVTICVNNTLSFQSIPPGVIEPDMLGVPHQRWFHDFYNYSGLHRSVWLTATPAQRIDDVTVVTGIDGADGIVTVETVVSTNSAEVSSAGVRCVLFDAEGTEVARADGVRAQLRVPDATLWAPGKGYLYDLLVQVLDGEVVADEYHLNVGIRTIEVRGTQFLVNGEPVHFTGFGMHDDHSAIGKGHNDALMLRDFACLEWIGANSVRTSHYPYSDDFMDHADRAGILVIDETPAVGINMGIGGGLFGTQGYQTFSDETVNEVTQANHAQVIRELMARDKNHPSVVLWCLANEPESETQEAEDYFRPLFALARETDPTRPVGFTNVMMARYPNCRVSKLADVIMLNRYYGWYVFLDDLPSAEKAWFGELSGWASEGKPIIIAEYGADTMPGMHDLRGGPWSEEYQQRFFEMTSRVFDSIPAVVGEHPWAFADFQTSAAIARVDGNKKGVFTRDRQPKAAAHWLRTRWTALTAGKDLHAIGAVPGTTQSEPVA